jgi:hypothetical protein
MQMARECAEAVAVMAPLIAQSQGGVKPATPAKACQSLTFLPFCKVMTVTCGDEERC